MRSINFNHGEQDLSVSHTDELQLGRVLLVIGADTNVGRAMAVAAAANRIMVVGIGSSREEGMATQKLARDVGGQMVYMETDLTSPDEIGKVLDLASKPGAIRDWVYVVTDSEKLDRYVSPLSMAQLVVPLMAEDPNQPGIVATVAEHSTLREQEKLRRFIEENGKGHLRYYAITAGSGIDPWHVANVLIFRLSCYRDSVEIKSFGNIIRLQNESSKLMRAGLRTGTYA